MFLVNTTGLYSASHAAQSTLKESPSETRWDDWPCKNLNIDWNYLFHPDRINQYHLPKDTIDEAGQDQGLVPYLEDRN
jgi:hypothetical protein